MPTFNPDTTFSTRAAKLLGDYALRNQEGHPNPLSGRDWFAMKIKELGREFILTEYRMQKAEGPQDPVPAELDTEVT